MKLTAKIEMSAGDQYKYEIKNGVLTLDRPLFQDVPANYGYILGTKAADGDATDVFIISTAPIAHGANVSIRLISGYLCLDNGVKDDKLIAVIEGENPPPFTVENDLVEIERYLRSYKEGFKVTGYVNAAEAYNIVKKDTL